MGWAMLWAIYLQTHLVTLFGIRKKFCFEINRPEFDLFRQ
jgi:hypothetical protein